MGPGVRLSGQGRGVNAQAQWSGWGSALGSVVRMGVGARARVRVRPMGGRRVDVREEREERASEAAGGEEEAEAQQAERGA